MSEVSIVLVVGSLKDENSWQVVDLKGISKVGDNIFLIRTKPFDDSLLTDRAGEDVIQEVQKLKLPLHH